MENHLDIASRIAASLQNSIQNADWCKYHGPACDQLIEVLCRMMHRHFARPVSSGTIAVELALRGVGVTPGDEVILGGYDFPGNFRAIEAIGARPVLVDVRPNSWTMDPEALKRAIGPETRAVVVSHLHGDLASLTEIESLASSHRVAVIEDACQTPGAELAGRPAGSFGDVSVLSFGGSKLLTAGRGGAILTNDAKIDQRIRVFADRGNDAFPLSELQATVLIPQLESLPELTALRHDRAKRLANLLPPELSSPAGTRPDSSTPEERSAFYKLGLLVADELDRDTLLAALLEETEHAQLPAVWGSSFRGFAKRSARRCRVSGRLDHANRAASQTILLHHAPALTLPDPDLERLDDAVHRAVHRVRGS